MTSGPGFVGLYTLRRAVAALGSRALPPKSTALGRALHEPECSPLLRDLGLERRAKSVPDLSTYLAARAEWGRRWRCGAS